MNVLIREFTKLGADDEFAGLVAVGGQGLDTADDLGVDVETAGDVDDLLGMLGRQIDFHAVTHVEHLVHLGPVGAALLLDGAEEGRNGEHVVFDDTEAVDEMEYLRLGTACAMDHAVHEGTHLAEQLLDDRGVGAGGREYQMAGIDGSTFHGIRETESAGIDEVVGHGVVITLGVFLGQVLGEDIVAGTGETVAAHAAVVGLLVQCLSAGGEADDNVASTDVGVVDDVGAAHAAGDRAVHDDGAYEVAHVSRFAARGIDADTHGTQFGQQFIGAIDDGADDFARDEHLVAADGGGDEDVVRGSHAEQVVDIHDERILGDALPYAEVTRLLPVEVG